MTTKKAKRSGTKAKNRPTEQEVRNLLIQHSWERLRARAAQNGTHLDEEALTCPDCRDAATGDQLDELLGVIHGVFKDSDGGACPEMVARATVAAGLMVWIGPGSQNVEEVLRAVDELIVMVVQSRLNYLKDQVETSAPGGDA